MPGSDGPFKALEKIGPDAYNMDLPGDYGVSAAFNTADLSPYHDEDEGLLSLRINSNYPRGEDEDHPLEPLEDHQASIKELTSTNEIKEVHMLVQEVTNQPMHWLSNSDRI